MSKPNLARLSIIAAPTAAWLALAPLLYAQYQIDNSRALDSNNRLGANGRNDGTLPPLYGQGNQIITGNQVITGNVTAGQAFRGFVPYTDPLAFRGPTAGAGMDSFVRNSTGIPSPYTTSSPGFQQPQPFYGLSRAVPPPAGYVEQSATGGFVPGAQPNQFNPGETRLGIQNNVGELPKAGQSVQPGPVDPTGYLSLPNLPTLPTLPGRAQLPLSPLLAGQGGAEPLTSEDLLQSYTRNNFRRSSLTERSALSERQASLIQHDLAQNLIDDSSQGQSQPAGAESQILGRPMSNSLESPDNRPLADNRLGDQLGGNGPLSGNLQTRQGLRQRLAGTPSGPAAGSTQYAEMQRRLQRYQAAREMTDAEAHREFQEQLRSQEAKRAQESAASAAPMAGLPNQMPVAVAPSPLATPKTPTPAELGSPDYAKRAQELLAQPGKSGAELDKEKMARMYTPTVAKPEPLEIDSLANGVHAQNLAGMLSSAEALMKQGRFTSALDKYDEAARTSPGNPLIALGKAMAELGASFYTRADKDLRDAITTDPALLVGRYNLKQFLGQERVDYLLKDLQEIANADEKDERPAFLLAYVFYNTGNAAKAAEYLDLTEKRLGHNDKAVQLMRDHWTLPAVRSVK